MFASHSEHMNHVIQFNVEPYWNQISMVVQDRPTRWKKPFCVFLWVAAIVNSTLAFSWKFDLKVSGYHIHRIDDEERGQLGQDHVNTIRCACAEHGNVSTLLLGKIWMIAMGDRGILRFVSEPVRPFSLKLSQDAMFEIFEKFGECGGKSVVDVFVMMAFCLPGPTSGVCMTACFFVECDTIWKIFFLFKIYLWDNLCVGEIGNDDQDQFEHTGHLPMVLGDLVYLFGGVSPKCDLRWVLFKLQDSRS